MVYLIRYDSATNWLSAIDSQLTRSNVPDTRYSFLAPPDSAYYVKAAVGQGCANVNSLIPTYYDSSAYWSSAKVIHLSIAGAYNQDIYMLRGIGGSGPGFIGGNVALGANKGAASGVEGQLMFLRDNQSKIVGNSYTDASGNYSFNNLPLGSYSTYPDLINFTTVPFSSIQLTAGTPEFRDGNFNKDELKHNLAPRNTGIDAAGTKVNAIVVSPNPAHAGIAITWHSLESVNAAFVMTTISGQEVMRTATIQTKVGQLNLDVSHLAKGLYFVRGTGTLTGMSSKIVLQ